MAAITVKIQGLDRLKRNMSRYPQISRPLIDKAIRTSIDDILGDARPNTPVDTGKLKGSYKKKFGKLRGEVGTNTKYDIYVHDGTSRMRARPFLKKAVENKQAKIDKNFLKALDEINKKIA